ncbi:NAD(P)/FAD-dependent oxidoreductase [Terrabacter aerolatus]|uniref:FAD-dependent oxidoreductase n=1 Tax=Terrabacter aerolatus TaxID=422442 RepID=A0A512D4R6_9MICO|nr:NAD(P)/FAD-dependent oxidoreductase [Terrabacter aerolatus]GEO31250.1 FAD-dependent oxidoreductase [Terrabacter aerolatus]
MPEEIDVVVVGAGQAGLATSHELGLRGIEHVVLEASEPGSSWLGRWDSFTLVGPNHTVRLPGAAYAGDDPDGFMSRTEVADHLRAYAGRLGRVRSGMPVHGLWPREHGGYELRTDGDTIRSRVVVVATGAYQRPLRPAAVRGLAPDVPCVDVLGYRNPAGLPDGPVLVVGSGQSACQIAEELAVSGRDVVMACGRAPWFLRRVGGRDLFEWLMDSPFYEQTPDQLATPAARHGANVQASGGGGGHDLHYRTLAALGVRLMGHLLEVDGHTARFAPDLAEVIAAGDAGFRFVRDTVVGVCRDGGMPVPDIPEPRPLDTTAPTELDLRGFGAVVVATGFRSRYTEWIDVPGLVDDQGFPVHVDGESVVAPDLHFVGVHFLRRRRSSLLFGVGDDATATATRVAVRLALPT